MRTIVVLLIAAMFTGCASYLKVAEHNSTVDRKALMLKIDAQASGQPTVGVGLDLLGAKGYFGAWKADKKGMAGATLTDAVLAGLVAWGVNELDDDSDSAPASSSGVSVSVEGGVSAPMTVNVVAGDGNSSNNDDSTAGTSNRDMQ